MFLLCYYGRTRNRQLEVFYVTVAETGSLGTTDVSVMLPRQKQAALVLLILFVMLLWQKQAALMLLMFLLCYYSINMQPWCYWCLCCVAVAEAGSLDVTDVFVTMAETGSLGVNMVEFVLGGGSPTNRNAQDRNRMTGAFVSVTLDIFCPARLCFSALSVSVCLFLSPWYNLSWLGVECQLSVSSSPPSLACLSPSLLCVCVFVSSVVLSECDRFYYIFRTADLQPDVMMVHHHKPEWNDWIALFRVRLTDDLKLLDVCQLRIFCTTDVLAAKLGVWRYWH